jgi:hypothetical protein
MLLEVGEAVPLIDQQALGRDDEDADARAVGADARVLDQRVDAVLVGRFVLRGRLARRRGDHSRRAEEEDAQVRGVLPNVAPRQASSLDGEAAESPPESHPRLRKAYADQAVTGPRTVGSEDSVRTTVVALLALWATTAVAFVPGATCRADPPSGGC